MKIAESLQNSCDVINAMKGDDNLHERIREVTEIVVDCLTQGNKLLFIGNGGSAAEAQHMSTEYVSRFMLDRPGLKSMALTTDTSALTAIGNDYGFEKVFSRQIQALASSGDVLFAYSTSGASINVINGLEQARSQSVRTIGMMGAGGKDEEMANLCDVIIRVPSDKTPHVQEGHMIIGHLICGGVEELFFNR